MRRHTAAALPGSPRSAPVQVGANLWIDFEAGELARLERQLASTPQLAGKIVHFEGCELLLHQVEGAVR